MSQTEFIYSDGKWWAPPKDPDDVLDYTINWAKFLDQDTIATSTFTVVSGITKDGESNTTTSSTVWLSGGTIGQTYQISCRITTVGGRTKDQSFYIKVEQQ